MKNKPRALDLVLFKFEAKNLSKPEIANCTILEILPQIEVGEEFYRNFWCILKNAEEKIFNRWKIGQLPSSPDLQIKVSELLKFDFSEETHHTHWSPDFKRFLFTLQVKLRELGFQKTDGIFMMNEFNFKLNF